MMSIVEAIRLNARNAMYDLAGKKQDLREKQEIAHMGDMYLRHGIWKTWWLMYKGEL